MTGPATVVVRQKPVVKGTADSAGGIRVHVRSQGGLTSYRDAPAPVAARIVTGGLQGPQGPPGGSGAPQTFEYVQTVPSTSWTVIHNLGVMPSAIAVYDGNGNEVLAGTRVIDLNSIEVTFAVPTAGRVEVS